MASSTAARRASHKVGGGDPVQVIRDLGDRVPLLHIKDGPANNPQEPMLAAGEGAMGDDTDGTESAGGRRRRRRRRPASAPNG